VTPVAVVTGAASGIGAATSECFQARGWQVVGVDRVAGPGIRQADITDARALAAVAGGVDSAQALVCAAGVLLKATIATRSSTTRRGAGPGRST
jgi:2-hydroxycyclohexanecarboxyl-CoA dehydrogenase